MLCVCEECVRECVCIQNQMQSEPHSFFSRGIFCISIMLYIWNFYSYSLWMCDCVASAQHVSTPILTHTHNTHNTHNTHKNTKTHTQTHKNTYIHTHTHARAHTHTHTHTHSDTHAHTLTPHTHSHIHIHTYTHTHTHTHTHTRTHSHTHTCTHAHMHSETQAHSFTHIYTHTHTHSVSPPPTPNASITRRPADRRASSICARYQPPALYALPPRHLCVLHSSVPAVFAPVVQPKKYRL